MTIMCDTNVILDVLLEREPFVNDSCKVLSFCEKHRTNGFVSASSVTDIYYLVWKYTHSTELAYKAVGKLLEIVKVCSATNNDVLIAFQKKAKDFKDSLVATCTRSIVVIASLSAIKRISRNLAFPFSLLRNFYSKSHSPYKPTLHFFFHIPKYGLLCPGPLLL